MYDEYVEQFKLWQAQYGSQTALFYQVGKFYEFYDILNSETGEGQTTTRKIADFLGIKLIQKKASGRGNREGLWAGVPTQSLHNFAMRLTRENWTCVIVDEFKDEHGKITRKMARVLSPGTHIESAENAAMESMFLGCIFLQEQTSTAPKFGASVVDLTTGEVVSYESQAVGRQDLWASDDLLHFFQVHSPRECIVYWNGDVLTMPQESFLRGRLGLATAQIHLKSANGIAYLTNPLQREEILARTFSRYKGAQLPLKQRLHIQDSYPMEMSLCLLLRFIEDHVSSLSETLQVHRVWNPKERLFLGNNVLTQLNFLTSRPEDSILHIFMHTHTLMGRRAMRQRLLYPITTVEKINSRLNQIQTLKDLSDKERQTLHHAMQSISDLSRLHRKIQTYTVTAADVLLLEQSYGRVAKLAEQLNGTNLAMCSDLSTFFKEYRPDFSAHFDISKAEQQSEELYFLPKERAPLTSSIEEQLDGYRQEVISLIEKIARWAKLPVDSLRIESRETLLYAITGTKTTMRQVANYLKSDHPPPTAGMTVTEKKSGANLNIPFLETLHQKVADARAALAAAFQTELEPICQSLVDRHIENWASLEEWIGNLDATLTLERVARERGFQRPIVSDGERSSVSIEGLRHPLIESQQRREEYVKHNISLGLDDSNLGWLLYGMNASGKSSLMKALGIAVVLAQAGSFVPAVSMNITPYSAIFTRILNHDNLWAGLSSFAVEMTELREILLRADKFSLILGDEVCCGTESVSATSLVASALKWLVQRNSCFLFATHLHGLQAISEIRNLKGLQTWHLRVVYNVATGHLHYDRALHVGAGSTLYGLEVARALGLPHSFLEQAMDYRHDILGTVSEEAAPTSSWNRMVTRRECGVCHSEFARDIEVHHIRPRAEADKTGHFPDGTHQDHVRNLIAVCSKCHDDFHRGTVSTSAASSVEPVSHKSKWTSEQQGIVINMLRENPSQNIDWILYKLEERHGIEISSATLRKVKRTGAFS